MEYFQKETNPHSWPKFRNPEKVDFSQLLAACESYRKELEQKICCFSRSHNTLGNLYKVYGENNVKNIINNPNFWKK